MSMSAQSVAGNPLTDDQSGRGIIRVQGVFPNLEVKDRGGYQNRHKATLDVLREVFTKFAPDFVGRRYDFFIGSFDNPESCNVLAEVAPTVLTYSVTDWCRPNIIAVPDFIYGGWPEAGITSYAETVAAITKAGRNPPKHDKVFWIGNAMMHDDRLKLLEIGQNSRDDMEFIGMDWLPSGAPTIGRLPATRFVSLPKHADYSMLLDIRGAGYSGRLKLLMQAGRPVFIVERPFREFFYEHLKPFEHYMPVKADLSDLSERVVEVKRDKAFAEKLGRGALAFAERYLTLDFALDHWRGVLVEIGILNEN